MLRVAAEVARNCRSKKTFRVGAVAVRNRDGVVVTSANGRTNFPCGSAHAEARVLRKAGFESTIYVARIARKDGKLALSRPCSKCMPLLKSFRIKKCYYSIDEYSYGVIEYRNNKFYERIKRIYWSESAPIHFNELEKNLEPILYG